MGGGAAGRRCVNLTGVCEEHGEARGWRWAHTGGLTPLTGAL